MIVDEDVIVEAENTEAKRSNGFGRIVKSRKSYVLQDFRKLVMGVEIIVNMFQG